MTNRVDVRIIIALLLLALGFALGSFRGGGESGSPGISELGEAAAPTIWTCSMHPQIQLPEPGQCPICGMDLIPLTDEAGDDAEGPTLSMSTAAKKLAEIQTTAVKREFPHVVLRLVGKVEYDETRQRQISAWVGGRLDRLYVDYTGISIRRGDHLAELYSPELISAQEELLQSALANRQLQKTTVESLRGTAASTLEASREKLRLLGLSAKQIASIEERGVVEEHVTINSPIDGIVIAKRAVEGDYVKTGSAIYEIADLSHVWVKLDAYESDLEWLRYGQTVKFSAEAYPGRFLEGKIAFIDPVLSHNTRTAKVRVNVDNSDGLLKPGMFVRATVRADVMSGGRVMDLDLAGKWMCPMHPEVVKNGPGNCDICGMSLVRAEDLGYVLPARSEVAPLVIPASAPLITGTRAVVYVELPNTDRPTFEGREVILGPRANKVYIVESGLVEGDRVVTNGAFKIDSAMQISAKPSMMSSDRSAASTGHEHGASGNAREQSKHVPGSADLDVPVGFQEQLGELSESYLKLTAAMAADDAESALAAAATLPSKLGKMSMALLQEEAHTRWMEILAGLEPATADIAASKDLEELRARLPVLTEHLSTAIRSFGVGKALSVLRFHCPMARDGLGADWLQSREGTENPYFGAAMFKCGEQVEMLASGGSY